MNSMNEGNYASAPKRAHFQTWIQDRRPPLSITLGANRIVQVARLRMNATHFFNRVHRDCYGTRWYKKDPDLLAEAIGFLEHPNSNPHFHIAVNAPDRVLDRLVNSEAIWKGVQPGGHFHYSVPKSQEAFSRYVTKDAWSSQSQAEIFLYSRR